MTAFAAVHTAAFTGKLARVEVHMDDDQALDGDSLGAAELARE